MTERASRGPLQVFDNEPSGLNDQLSKIREELDELHNATVEAEEADALELPPGVIFAYAGATAPEGYLFCDGSAVSRTTYAALFAAIEETWGAGDASTTFNVPDFRGRTIYGKAAAGTFNTLAGSVGAESATLPAHTHTLAAGVALSQTGAGDTSTTTGNPNSSPTIATVAPGKVAHWIIKT